VKWLKQEDNNYFVMKKIHFIYWIALVAICVALFSACKETVTDVTLNKNELILAPGDTETLIATVHPENADNKTVTWASSNPEVATITNNGLVTAIANGETTITVTTKDGKKTATCVVTVDYRAQWTGDWDFEVERDCCVMGEVSIGTYYCLGIISYGNASDQLKIEYQNISIFVNIDKFGKLFYDTYREHVEGQFENNDTIYMVYESSGLAYSCTHTINGIKKKGEKNE